MKDEIKEILEELKEKNETYKECSENGIIENEYYKSHILLDYITNLQNGFKSTVEELCETTEKLEILQEENERLKDEKPEYILRWKLEEQLEDYKSRNKKTIEDIDLVIELIKQQPTEDDSWILNKLNGFKYLLNGGDE